MSLVSCKFNDAGTAFDTLVGDEDAADFAALQPAPSLTPAIICTFSEAINAASVANTVLDVSDFTNGAPGGPASYTVALTAPTKLSITFNSPLAANKHYRITVWTPGSPEGTTQITAAGGNPFGGAGTEVLFRTP